MLRLLRVFQWPAKELTECTFQAKFASICDQLLKEIGEAIMKSKLTIPSALDLCTSNVSEKTGLKSTDWNNMLRFIVPTVIVEHIKDQEARDAPVALSQSCTIVFQNAITTSELRELDKRV
ncbi:hypothetical protein BDC45DRAFT_541622 [Circinella umbellata]|nr:hypothetical protein BDC45DRAFT_541622 [Circinella umbellata]